MSFKYPKSVFCIIATEFCERFSFCGLRINLLAILSLYLRNELLVPENSATIVYHIFIMLCYIGPLLGAVFADSILGRYRTILYFSLVYLIGNIVMCLAATPPLNLPPLISTIIGLILIAIGTGGIKPCVAAFGGDQFILPDEEYKLQGFFSMFYFAINTGGLAGMLATPALRKSVSCFGEDTCYSLGFGFPAILMLLALLVFMVGRPWYRLRKPKDNILIKFINCTMYAIKKKMQTQKSKRNKGHWLDYAENHCEKKLIDDMKIMYAIMFLYIPLPLYWSLFDQQGSRWTFQASRTNGTVSILGMKVQILADQMQVVNPVIVLMFIPIFERVVYPRCVIIRSPLRKMVVGGIAAGTAFLASGILELQLQKTYPILPTRHTASLNVINTLPCPLSLVGPDTGQGDLRVTNIQSEELSTYRNISIINNHTFYNLEVSAPLQCGNITLEGGHKQIISENIKEMKTETLLVGMKDDASIFLYLTEPVDFSKSLNGKPRIRIAYMHGGTNIHNVTVSIINSDNPSTFKDEYFISDYPVNSFSLSEYMDLAPGNYGYKVKSKDDSVFYNGNINLELGGVYTLVIQEFRGRVYFTKLYTMVLPNRVHMLWLLPQYFLISVGEIMFAISGLEFSFTQAPKSMKTIVIAAWYLTVALGNFLVILITQARVFKKQSHEFFLFAVLIFIDMGIFSWMCITYKFVPLESDGLSSTDLRQSRSRNLETDLLLPKMGSSFGTLSRNQTHSDEKTQTDLDGDSEDEMYIFIPKDKTNKNNWTSSGVLSFKDENKLVLLCIYCASNSHQKPKNMEKEYVEIKEVDDKIFYKLNTNGLFSMQIQPVLSSKITMSLSIFMLILFAL